ncbi:MAG: ribosomal RNA small subunit methyltransferase A [Chitinophagaceae bacterium]|jgi:16S rRNA (adenine1518-N6/adenine1519-N6)-dimethyltransferase|nr:ribosomal RNA small subunit methyltransferase A [Chitinophagaceae bacterium]MCE2973453.1 16S rRNA (adenine(1518)-N(6)/adenine(1519)-N(6))-dimethyltransferase RsmA [Sediminibacterium sp.]MCA6471703.1 ribosomal RNA small subunit methyltransferase A [Chitinophagaceae bacterium]MCA6476581.1 ribosomal RNA small subunit methyltransferase A [Chitinophagaceae bacterium]MCA6485300.1 ribosomal RNA small subunit methyltransferase A [Chitinophagaceae bacterium]
MEYTLKKSLGQHFLKDELICRQLVDVWRSTNGSHLLEVGPGGGALTRFLLELEGVEFKAVELDEEKVNYLHKKYPSLQGKLIQGSILDIDCPFDVPFTLMGNFPYNISTQIVFRVLEWRDKVPVMIGMFQKEVAERIVAPPGSRVYGILSVLVQAYYEAEYLFDVPPTSFDPPPKVVSGVLRLKRKADEIPVRSERALWVLVKTAFNQRRKMLRNAVKSLFTEETLKQPIFDQRAEQLSVQQFAALTFQMK